MTDKQWDDLGRFTKRKPNESSDKFIVFRVTKSEFDQINKAKKQGFSPRNVVLNGIKPQKVSDHDRDKH